MSPETCPQHAQFDHEIKQLLEQTAGLEANMMHVIRSLDRLEKALSCLEKAQSDQRVTDAAQSQKINTMWSFLIDKNGLLLIGILAYVVLGRVM
jgi:hypothetical protein